ncbi:MAG: U32 family peptidase [Sphingomonadaceae bacterium]
MTAKLTLGPIQFHWDADVKRDFYARVADESPVDIVYLGEVVCSKRTPFFEREIPAVVERLERGGKQVIFSTLAEIVLPRERAMIADLCSGSDRMVEVNNVAGLMAIGDRPHCIGPMMNVYNEHSMAHLARRGASHFVAPAELPGPVIAKLAATARELGVAVEVQVFGRVPLAISSRCFHARAHRRSKDECQFVCGEDPDGLDLATLGAEQFLTINGVQTMSHGFLAYAREIEPMLAAGVTQFRLLPHSVDMTAVARVFADLVAGRIEAGAALERLAESGRGPFINGFWHGAAGHRYLDREAALAG